MEFSSQRNITARGRGGNATTRLWAFAGAACALAGAFLAGQSPARAQVVTPPRKTEEPSQNNPFPKAFGDAQNRGRAGDDKYWGVTDSNRAWSDSVFARLLPLVEDGWTFPARAGDDINRAAIVADNSATLRYPLPSLTPPIPGAQSGAIGYTDSPVSAWSDQPATAGRLSTGSVTGPSFPQPGDANYQRAIAVARPATTAVSYPQQNKFSWYPRIPGDAGVLRRYSIRVYIPQVAPLDAAPAETRIPDARYVVYYQVRLPSGGVENRSKVCRAVSQEIEGYQTLVGEDGAEAFFPMFSEATYVSAPAGLERARVELDNTTEDDITDRYVIADRIEFVAQQDTVRATPVVTPRHDGRKVTKNDLTTRGNALYDQTYQPQAGPDVFAGDQAYGFTGANPDWYQPTGAAGPALLNDSFAFANNPRDPMYDPASANFVPPTSPYYVPFDPSEPASLFQGPTALIDPRATVGGVANTVVNGRDATNFERYPAPYFSHMQVILARTEFVPDPNDFVNRQFAGTRTLEVGAVYSLDWLTGTVLWRFPDRTHLPALVRRRDNTIGVPVDPNGNTIPRAGLRNPIITDPTLPENRDPNNGQPIAQIPGIAAYDKNMDGYISDDEVFIGPAGGNGTGGISSSVTIAPNIQVQGAVQIPTYDINYNPYTAASPVTTAINGVVDAPEGRYATPVDPADPTGGRLPVNIPVAYVASNNGVIYAIDPYGNNDNRYYEFQNAGTVNTAIAGQFRAGTTNVLWTFNAQVAPRAVDADNVAPNNSELLEDYYKRLKQNIPATGAFGTSAPAIAYNLEDTDPLLNRDSDEPRLFIGNANGVVYALDARAVAGKDTTGGRNVLLSLPFRKGDQPAIAGLVNPLISPNATRHRTELKWWFEAENAVVSSPAVSVKQLFKENKGDAANDPSDLGGGNINAIVSKGVYFTSLDGRVYCVDWAGPTRVSIPHVNTVIWDGTAGTPQQVAPDANTATELNDNFRFHNDNAALELAKADGTEGTIRPRWAFPQRYRDIDGRDLGGSGDNSILVPRKPTDASRALSGALAEPDSLGPIYSSPTVMDFLWDDPATAGYDPVVKHYVVVTANDRASTNEPARQGRVYLLDQAGDRRDFLNNPVARTAGSPAQTIVFGQPLDRYTPIDFVMGKATPAWTYRSQYDVYDSAGQPIMNERNSPRPPTVGEQVLLPSKRLLPTIFAGGVGRLFAIDIDPATGLFMRWRGSARVPNEAAQRAMGPMPRTATGAGFLFPPAEPVANRLNPVPAVITRAGLTDFQIFARTVKTGGDTSSVDGSITITGGPRSNRNNTVTTGNTGRPKLPTAPPLPTNDAPNLAPPTVAVNDLASATPTNFDEPGRFVNQDIGDGVATTRGSFAVTPADTTNRAYQFPTLFVTTAGGNILEISTNIEGEDSSTLADPLYNETSALGWALTTDLERFNVNDHVILYLATAPGGPGTGVGVFTNAYFPSLDPRYRNTRAKPPTTGYPADTTTGFPAYPPQEPNIAARTDAPLLTDPRPDFQPRGLYAGDAQNPGPDGALGTPDDILTPPDLHTGQTGFPLDLNGLFYDKAFARVDNAASVTPLRETNDDGKVRLPGYSGIGTKAPNTPRVSDDVPNQLPREVVATNGTVTSFFTDDINPAGQNAVWILSGGSNGVLYAITPALAGIVTPGAGGASGLGAGGGGGYDGYGSNTDLRDRFGRRGVEAGGRPKIDIFDAADFIALQAAAQGGTAIRPDRDGSLTGRGGLTATYANPYRSRAFKNEKNFFEWGEAVYMVAYDVAPTASSVRVRIVNPLNNAVVLDRPIALERVQSGGVAGAVSTYAYIPELSVPPTPAADPANPGRLGLAFVAFELNGSNSNTPGAYLEVSVSANNGTGFNSDADSLFNFSGGANSTQILANINPIFSIANPIALQAFLSNTDDNLPAGLNISGSDRPLANAIGPFRADDGAALGAGSVKNSIRDNNNPPALGTDDPDKLGSEYSQALSNGNQIVRLNLNPYQNAAGTTSAQRNQAVTQRITNAAGEIEPDFYIPIAAGAGYTNHGQTAGTDLAPNRRNFRVINRSLLASLTRVRVEPMGDLIWRAWPGRKMNVDATDTTGGANPRYTPVGMRGDGVINPLPWEQPIIEPQPWKQNLVQFTPTGTIQSRGNPSQDYRDMALQSADKSTRRLEVDAASGDISRARGTFSASIGRNGDGSPQNNASLLPATGSNVVQDPFAPSNSAYLQQWGVNVQIKIPLYQPANLVAAHSLTSTYVPPSLDDDPLTTTSSGPVQLPRDLNQRQLVRLNGGGATISPFGYTTRIRVFVDSNPNGVWDINEAYREAEVWVGVPVDMSMKAVQTQVDLGGLPQGFGIGNGPLGYGLGSFPQNTGFLPPPLPQAGASQNYYEKFFKPFTIQNTGNVNLYNLRASQKFSNNLTGANFLYFGMLSDTANPLFGLMAAGADPNASIGVRPQVVTSLDQVYDGLLDAAVAATPDFQLRTDPANASSPTRYQKYYAGFGGAHTLHKPLPGATNPTVLSIPDVPNVQLQPTRDAGGNPILLQPRAFPTQLGVSVPIGTPSGDYFSQLGTPPYDTFNSPFAIFEDHDTDQAYQSAPRPTGSVGGLTILPAGPLYGGRNSVHPNDPTAGRVAVQPTSAQSILRPRAVINGRAGAAAQYEYLPYTNPTIRLKATVTEAPLTGGVADQIDGGSLPTSITTGILPFVDPFPLIQNTANGFRAMASGSPAAVRNVANGNLDVYYVANASAATTNGTRTPNTEPGQPFKLFHTHLAWDSRVGTWTTATPGAPVATADLNAGRWFTEPQAIETANPNAASESNLTPFVLNDPRLQSDASASTLFFLNSAPTAGGSPTNQIYYAALGADGTPGTPQTFLQNADASVVRYGPRAIFAPSGGGVNGNTTIALYAGRSAGGFTLFYAAASANGGGQPTGKARQERPLIGLPTGLTSATEPSGVLRLIGTPGNERQFVDVYYTGILRSSQNPDVFMTRFAIRGGGQGAQLAPADLPRVIREVATAKGLDPIWRTQHVGWYRSLSGDDTRLPIVYINNNAIGSQANWKIDAASGLLYQAITLGGRTAYVYADTGTGVITFRGANIPQPRSNGDVISVSYSPTTYRVTTDGASDASAIAVPDRTFAPATLTANPNLRNSLITRPNGDLGTASGPRGIDRQYLFWQKGARGGPDARPTLYYASKRVGIDLRSISADQTGKALSPKETISLTAQDATTGNQKPDIISLTVGGANVPYEVDVANGRIYFEGIYEGLTATISYRAVVGAQVREITDATATLTLIDEVGASEGGIGGRAVPMRQAVNEAQPYAFLDLYDGTGINRPANQGYPQSSADPTLRPGRIWMFWTSPRARQGVPRTGNNAAGVGIPSGYDIYWQTLAPYFESPSFSGLPPK